MGGGDIKLLAIIGAFLGWQSLPFVVFASSVTGVVAAGVWAMADQTQGRQDRYPRWAIPGHGGPALSLVPAEDSLSLCPLYPARLVPTRLVTFFVLIF